MALKQFRSVPVKNSRDWKIQQHVLCNNGFWAWFTVATVREPGLLEVIRTDGQIEFARNNANEIVNALHYYSASSEKGKT